jgi:hypothetical protein
MPSKTTNKITDKPDDFRTTNNETTAYTIGISHLSPLKENAYTA